MSKAVSKNVRFIKTPPPTWQGKVFGSSSTSGGKNSK